MWRILTRALRTGTVTASLETLDAPAPPTTRGRPALDVDLCDGNGACERACPTGAIRLGLPQRGADPDRQVRREWRLDYGACIFCGLCAEVCVPAALRLTGDVTLSTLRREDLIVRAAVAVPAAPREETP